MSSQINTFESIDDLRRLQFVRDWLQFKAPSTQKTHLSYIIVWFRWLRAEGDPRVRDLGPRELVALQEELNRSYARGEILASERKLILNEALRYIQERGAGWRSGTKRKVLSTIRSFFVWHLDRDGFPNLRRGESRAVLRSEVRKVRKELDIYTLKRIVDKSNPMYRAVFSCMFSSGMGPDEVVTWSDQGLGELEEALRNVKTGPHGEELLEVFLPARKGNTDNDCYVYVGGSALKNLRNWLRHREKLKARFNTERLKKRRQRARKESLPKKFPDSIFITNIFTPITGSGAQAYYRRKVHELYIREKVENGGPGTRYGVNLHQVRSVFRTRWAKAEANRDIGEYFMGHTVDPLDYNQIHGDREYRIKAYCRALPFLDIETPDYGAKEEEVDSLRQHVKKLEEQLKEERRTRLMLEKKLSVQTEDIDNLSQGHADMKAEFTVRNKKIEKLENKVETLLEIVATSLDETGVTPFVDQANHLSLIEEALKRTDLIEMNEESMEYIVTYKDGKLTVKPLIHKSRRDASSSYKKK